MIQYHYASWSHSTYGLLLRCGLLGSGLFLGLGLLLEGGTQFVRGLDLYKVAGLNSVLEGLQESGVHPLLISGQVGLHVLFYGNGGGAGAVLELGDGFDDSCFVRHDDCGSGFALDTIDANENKVR